MANTLKFGNGQWATKEGSTLAYNDENGNYKPLPFNFDRDTTATRVNKQGLIEVVSNNEPRIDYTNDSKGALLLEPTRSNLVTYSENFNGTGWNVFGSSGGTCTRTLNYGISPQGIQNSTRVVFSDSNTALYFNISISVASTATIYVKGIAGEVIGFGFGGSVADGSDFTFNGEWQRLVFSDSSGGSVTINTWAASRNARDFEIYGAQLEQGSYATSYIPTNGSTVQRSAETCNGSGNSEVFNDSQGVLFANISALANDSTSKMYSLSDGTNSNRFYISLNSNNIDVNLRLGGSTQFGFGYSVNDIKLYHKILFKYEQSDFSLFVDGFKVATSSSGNIFPNGTLNSLSFDRGDALSDFYGKTKEIAYYDTALTDEELEYLTSYRSLNEMVTELNLNAL